MGNQDPNQDIDRSIIIIDTETTGVDRATSEVIELAVQYGFGTRDPAQLDENGNEVGAEQTTWRFKPNGLVGDSAKIHGITDEMLVNEQPFLTFAPRIGTILDEAQIIIGYNLNFDLDMLCAAFERCNFKPPDFGKKILIDPLALWRVMEPRKLEHAFARFVGGQLKGAHAAGVDVAATGDVLLGMLRDFGLSNKTWGEVQALASPEAAYRLGHTDHFKWTFVDGYALPIVTMTFGKHKGCRVDDPEVKGYLSWIANKGDFPSSVKEVAIMGLKLKERFLSWATTRYPPPAAPVVDVSGNG